MVRTLEAVELSPQRKTHALLRKHLMNPEHGFIIEEKKIKLSVGVEYKV